MEGGPTVVNLQEGDEDVLNLPAGFRFHPTDEEIITHYLTQKIVNPNFAAIAIGEVDLNKCEPWDLPKKAKMGEKEWYFFCQRDRKYPTGMRTNRATEMGYWKATGKDKEIYGKGGQTKQLVGMKKTLVFYKGRAPKGEKSNWVMHEFRLDGKLSYNNFSVKSAQDEWVVCKVFHKNAAVINKRSSMSDLMRMNSFVEGLLDNPPLPPLMDSSYNTNPNATPSFSNQIQMQHQQPASQNTTSIYNYQIPNSTAFFSQTPHYNFPYQPPSSSSYLHQQKFNSIYGSTSSTGGGLDLDHQRQCKVEQFSSNLSRSQDTGLSTDLTAEISSKQEVDTRIKTSFNGDVEGPDHPISDLDSFWNFQV